MKIDILRSTNPALSLSSQVDDGPGAEFYGKPSPEELVSPRHAATTRIYGKEGAESRSKSAPPTEWDNSRYEHSCTKSAAQLLTSFSYDKGKDASFLSTEMMYHRVPLRYTHVYEDDMNENGDDSSSTTSTRERDPEEVSGNPNLDVLGPSETRPAGVPQLQATETSHSLVRKAVLRSKGTKTLTTTSTTEVEQAAVKVHHFQQQQRQEQQQLQASQQLQQGSSSFASSSVSTQRNSVHEGGGGGVLVLRPQPFKTVPPISQQGVVVGGVVAPALRIASASFGASLLPPNPIIIQPPQAPPSPLHPDIARPPTPTFMSRAGGTGEPPQALQPQQQAQRQQDLWCQRATEKARKEKELKLKQEKERKRLLELRRRQEEQCNFPNSYSIMPPASGRASEEVEDRDNVSAAARLPNGAAYIGTRPQQQQQQQQVNNNRAGSGRSTTGSLPPRSFHRTEDDHNNFSNSNMHQTTTPVFERLVTDEVRELQVYARMVESQNAELDKMRIYQKDLEKRLQNESAQHEQLEAILEAREREWLMRFEELELEIKRLNGVVKAEENKNKLLLDQIRKKDQDIQGMLKKKYDHEGPGQRSMRGFRSNPPGDQRPDRGLFHLRGPEARSPASEMHKSPGDYLRSLGSTEKIRERNTRNLLMDFFGM